MSLELLCQNNVDIYQLPTPDSKYKATKDSQISIGDLHGNAMKLMFMLCKHGVVTNLSPDQYAKLATIYKKDPTKLSTKDLVEFNTILDSMIFNKDSFIRLVGDDLADRGNNDYFTLKILEKLHQQKVPVEILISNHGIEFLQACEIGNNFSPPMLQSHLAPSMINLQVLVDRKLISREEVLKTVKNAYKPMLRAISYSLSEDRKEISIFSHASIGIDTIQFLATKLGITYKDKTAVELAQTIDDINVAFQKHVEKNTVHTLYSRTEMMKGYYGQEEIQGANVFEFIMWNRFYENINRPALHHNYRINYIHGHDKQDPKSVKDNVYNLDNDLGKGPYSVGQYTAIYAKQSALSLNKTPCKEEYTEISSLLLELVLKEQELRAKNFLSAADKALDLFNSIDTHYKKFLSKEITPADFKKICLEEAIPKARPELEKHRGWKRFFGNLILAILGLGVVYAFAGLVNLAVNKQFLFFHDTNSAKLVNKLQEKIEEATYEAPFMEIDI